MTEAKQNLHLNYAKTLKIKAIFLARLPPLSCFSRKIASSILSKFKISQMAHIVFSCEAAKAFIFVLVNSTLQITRYAHIKRPVCFVTQDINARAFLLHFAFLFLFLVIAKGVSLEAIPLNSRFRLLRQPTASSQ